MNRTNALLAIPLIVALAGCGAKREAVEAAPKPQPLAVKTLAAATRHVDRVISVTGSLNPDETVNVSFEVAGRVSAIHTDFGQVVHKGDMLAELDKQEYQLQVDRTRAALNQALARLGLTPGQENTPPDSTPAMRQAQAQADDARFKAENAAKLVKSGDISQERFTELEKAYHARQAAFEMTRDDMRVQWANMDSLRADLKLSQKHLSDTVVRAPFDGAITQKLVSPGQYIKENTTVLTLVKSNPLRLLADLPESAAGEIRTGSTLTFTTDAIPDKAFHAVVRELNPSLDAKSRSLTVEARLSESDERLRPGMFVQVQLVTSRNAQVVVIPTQAIYTVAGLTKVFVIRDGHAVECRVAPAQIHDGWMEVPADQIQAGEMVAVSNLPALVNGAEVTSSTARAGL
jgi:RND family efflux transporter MFP subunit